jgi:hypothetical protein
MQTLTVREEQRLTAFENSAEHREVKNEDKHDGIIHKFYSSASIFRMLDLYCPCVASYIQSSVALAYC